MKIKWKYTMRLFNDDTGNFMAYVRTRGTTNLAAINAKALDKRSYLDSRDGCKAGVQCPWDTTCFILVLGDGHIGLGRNNDSHGHIRMLTLLTNGEYIPNTPIPDANLYLTSSTISDSVNVTNPVPQPDLSASKETRFNALKSYVEDIINMNSELSQQSKTVRYLIDPIHLIVVTFDWVLTE